jgi:hypothetical protein
MTESGAPKVIYNSIGLENNVSKDDNSNVPRGTIRDLDTESGSIGPKD